MRFSTVVCRLSQLRNCCKKKGYMQCSSICIVQIHWHIQNTQSLHKKSPAHVPVSPTAIYFFPCCLSVVLSAVESKFDLLFCIVPSLQISWQCFWERNFRSQIRIIFSMKLVFWFAIEWNFTTTLIFVELIQFADLKVFRFAFKLLLLSYPLVKLVHIPLTEIGFFFEYRFEIYIFPK